MRVAFESLAPPAAKPGDGVGGGGNLARRKERHGCEPLAGSLVGRIEQSDRLDPVVEQVEAKRLRRTGREQIHDRAAHRELARAQDLGDLRITGIRQPLAQPRQVDAFAGRKREGVRLDERAGREAIEQGGHAS